MEMFKRTKNTRNLHAMPADVYERNGIAQRPASKPPAADFADPRSAAREYARPGSNVSASLTTSRNTRRPASLPPLRSENHHIQPRANSSRALAIDITGRVNQAAATPVTSQNLPNHPHSSTNHFSQPNANTFGTRIVGAPAVDPLLPLHAHDPSAAPNNRSSSSPSDQETGPSATVGGPRRFLRSIGKTLRRRSASPNPNDNIQMRVYIKPHVQPGRLIRVLCPNQCILIATVPPQSEWKTGNSRSNNDSPQHYFRVGFDPSGPCFRQSLPNKDNLSACTCNPSLGVFDSACPCHGASANSNEENGGQNNSDEVIDDAISVAQEERGSSPPAERSLFMGDSADQLPNNAWPVRYGLAWECKFCSLSNDFQSRVCAMCDSGRYDQRSTEMQQTILDSIRHDTECLSPNQGGVGLQQSAQPDWRQQQHGMGGMGQQQNAQEQQLQQQPPASGTATAAAAAGGNGNQTQLLLQQQKLIEQLQRQLQQQQQGGPGGT